MNSKNLKSLSEKQLLNLQKQLTKELELRKKMKFMAAKSAISAKAKEFGYTLNEFIDMSSQHSKNANPKPKIKRIIKHKYIDPHNAANKWSGRGRMPKWLNKAIEEGKDLSEFKIS